MQTREKKEQFRAYLEKCYGITTLDSDLFDWLFESVKKLVESTPISEDDIKTVVNAQIHELAVTTLLKQDARVKTDRLTLAITAVGVLMTIAGSLMILASLGIGAASVIAPVLAPLAGVGLVASIAVTVSGVALTTAGVGMFAAKCKQDEVPNIPPKCISPIPG